MKKKETGIGQVIAGVAVGAAAGATAMALSDKNNRKKLVKTVNILSDKAQKIIKDTQKNPEVKKAVRKIKPEVEKAAQRTTASA
jgi:type III secretory pathway component EscU